MERSEDDERASEPESCRRTSGRAVGEGRRSEVVGRSEDMSRRTTHEMRCVDASMRRRGSLDGERCAHGAWSSRIGAVINCGLLLLIISGVLYY